jgi:16S rRNA (guanine(966)-N(2))-methyltransferase RsmD
MRIIAGTARHRIIQSVPDSLTRPTTDRIKESIFNILNFRIPGSEILDLFAGTGNMGLEAISRGAKSSVFVDLRKVSIDTINKNIETLGFTSQSKVIMSEAEKALLCLSSKGYSFDIIFCDPPYHMGLDIPAMELIESKRLLKRDGILIVRHHQKTKLPETLGAIEMYRQKKYGDCIVSFYRYIEEKNNKQAL